MNQNNKKVCVIGLGYVGFPLAVLCSVKGYDVFGYDPDEEKIKRIQKGENIVDEEYLDELIPQAKIKILKGFGQAKKCDIFLICVPTPVDEKYYPDLSYIKSAAENIAKHMKKGALVILESTVNPGVSEEVVAPIFEKEGWKIGKDVFISHCPERINPGDKVWTLKNIPRVVGSFGEKGLQMTLDFYKNILEAEVMPMKSIREAEAVKIVENSFRDVNIAFVNELARSFDILDIDVVAVIKGAATKPFAFMAHWPSCGVGGHCIPVDPYYLIEKAKENEFDHRFLRIAREINNDMRPYTVDLLRQALNGIAKPVKGTRIGILGVSYKANVGDLRESPAKKIIDLLKKQEAELYAYDPHLPEYSNVKSLDELLKKSEALVLVTDHDEFIYAPVEKFKENGIKVIIDGKNCLDKEKILELGIIYKGIGR